MKNFNDSIFWVEVEKISPNPYQPRKEFGERALSALSESIKQYGVLQPLVVTRKEIERDDGGLAVEYELIAGERRLRASKLAGILQVPVVIRNGEETDQMKLELAIIENLQREDLNPIERAEAFLNLTEKFGYTHMEISRKVGKSREYVSNSIRLLNLPQEMINAIKEGKITEGHSRPLLMLGDRPEEQDTLFKEIMFKKLTVREAERISRSIAVEKVRKKQLPQEFIDFEQDLSDRLGTRVRVEKAENGGKVVIDFFSDEDARNILALMSASISDPLSKEPVTSDEIEDIPPAEISNEEDSDLYSVENFSI